MVEARRKELFAVEASGSGGGGGGGGSGGGGGGGGNHVWNGQNYLLSWVEGVGDLTWEEAMDYCEANGMRVVSLDTEEKTQHFFKQVCCCLSINKLCVNNDGVT